MWNTADDLDLRVTTPAGVRIFYEQKRSPCGGVMDVDMNDMNAANAVQRSTTPVAHVYWPAETGAPAGEYKVEVHLYSFCVGTEDVPFWLAVTIKGNTQMIEGVCTDATRTVAAVTFDYDGNSEPAAATSDYVTELTPSEAYTLALRQIEAAQDALMSELDVIFDAAWEQQQNAANAPDKSEVSGASGDWLPAIKTDGTPVQPAMAARLWSPNDAVAESVDASLKSLEARHMQALALAARGCEDKQTGWTDAERASWKAWIAKYMEHKTWLSKIRLPRERHAKWMRLVSLLATASEDVRAIADRTERSMVRRLADIPLLEAALVPHMNLSGRSCMSASLPKDTATLMDATMQTIHQLEEEQLAVLSDAETASATLRLLCNSTPAESQPQSHSMIASRPAAGGGAGGGGGTGGAFRRLVSEEGHSDDLWSAAETKEWHRWAEGLVDHQLSARVAAAAANERDACDKLQAQLDGAVARCKAEMIEAFWERSEEVWELASAWVPALYERGKNLGEGFSPLNGLRACRKRDLAALHCAWEQNQSRWEPFYHEVARFEATGRSFEFPGASQVAQDQVGNFVRAYEDDLVKATREVSACSARVAAAAGAAAANVQAAVQAKEALLLGVLEGTRHLDSSDGSGSESDESETESELSVAWSAEEEEEAEEEDEADEAGEEDKQDDRQEGTEETEELDGEEEEQDENEKEDEDEGKGEEEEQEENSDGAASRQPEEVAAEEAAAVALEEVAAEEATAAAPPKPETNRVGATVVERA